MSRQQQQEAEAELIRYLRVEKALTAPQERRILKALDQSWLVPKNIAALKSILNHFNSDTIEGVLSAIEKLYQHHKRSYYVVSSEEFYRSLLLLEKIAEQAPDLLLSLPFTALMLQPELRMRYVEKVIFLKSQGINFASVSKDLFSFEKLDSIEHIVKSSPISLTSAELTLLCKDSVLSCLARVRGDQKALVFKQIQRGLVPEILREALRVIPDLLGRDYGWLMRVPPELFTSGLVNLLQENSRTPKLYEALKELTLLEMPTVLKSSLITEIQKKHLYLRSDGFLSAHKNVVKWINESVPSEDVERIVRILNEIYPAMNNERGVSQNTFSLLRDYPDKADEKFRCMIAAKIPDRNARNYYEQWEEIFSIVSRDTPYGIYNYVLTLFKADLQRSETLESWLSAPPDELSQRTFRKTTVFHQWLLRNLLTPDDLPAMSDYLQRDQEKKLSPHYYFLIDKQPFKWIAENIGHLADVLSLLTDEQKRIIIHERRAKEWIQKNAAQFIAFLNQLSTEQKGEVTAFVLNKLIREDVDLSFLQNIFQVPTLFSLLIKGQLHFSHFNSAQLTNPIYLRCLTIAVDRYRKNPDVLRNFLESMLRMSNSHLELLSNTIEHLSEVFFNPKKRLDALLRLFHTADYWFSNPDSLRTLQQLFDIYKTQHPVHQDGFFEKLNEWAVLDPIFVREMLDREAEKIGAKLSVDWVRFAPNYMHAITIEQVTSQKYPPYDDFICGRLGVSPENLKYFNERMDVQAFALSYCIKNPHEKTPVERIEIINVVKVKNRERYFSALKKLSPVDVVAIVTLLEKNPMVEIADYISLFDALDAAESIDFNAAKVCFTSLCASQKIKPEEMHLFLSNMLKEDAQKLLSKKTFVAQLSAGQLLRLYYKDGFQLRAVKEVLTNHFPQINFEEPQILAFDRKVLNSTWLLEMFRKEINLFAEKVLQPVEHSAVPLRYLKTKKITVPNDLAKAVNEVLEILDGVVASSNKKIDDCVVLFNNPRFQKLITSRVSVQEEKQLKEIISRAEVIFKKRQFVFAEQCNHESTLRNYLISPEFRLLSSDEKRYFIHGLNHYLTSENQSRLRKFCAAYPMYDVIPFLSYEPIVEVAGAVSVLPALDHQAISLNYEYGDEKRVIFTEVLNTLDPEEQAALLRRRYCLRVQDIEAANDYLKSKYPSCVVDTVSGVVESNAPYFYQLPRVIHSVDNDSKKALRSLIRTFDPKAVFAPIIFDGVMSSQSGYLNFWIYKHKNGEVSVFVVDPRTPANTNDRAEFYKNNFALFQEIFPNARVRIVNSMQQRRNSDSGYNVLSNREVVFSAADTGEPVFSINTKSDEVAFHPEQLACFEPVLQDVRTKRFVYKNNENFNTQRCTLWQEILEDSDYPDYDFEANVKSFSDGYSLDAFDRAILTSAFFAQAKATFIQTMTMPSFAELKMGAMEIWQEQRDQGVVTHFRKEDQEIKVYVPRAPLNDAELRSEQALFANEIPKLVESFLLSSANAAFDYHLANLTVISDKYEPIATQAQRYLELVVAKPEVSHWLRKLPDTVRLRLCDKALEDIKIAFVKAHAESTFEEGWRHVLDYYTDQMKFTDEKKEDVQRVIASAELISPSEELTATYEEITKQALRKVLDLKCMQVERVLLQKIKAIQSDELFRLLRANQFQLPVDYFNQLLVQSIAGLEVERYFHHPIVKNLLHEKYYPIAAKFALIVAQRTIIAPLDAVPVADLLTSKPSSELADKVPDCFGVIKRIFDALPKPLVTEFVLEKITKQMANNIAGDLRILRFWELLYHEVLITKFDSSELVHKGELTQLGKGVAQYLTMQSLEKGIFTGHTAKLLFDQAVKNQLQTFNVALVASVESMKDLSPEAREAMLRKSGDAAAIQRGLLACPQFLLAVQDKLYLEPLLVSPEEKLQAESLLMQMHEMHAKREALLKMCEHAVARIESVQTKSKQLRLSGKLEFEIQKQLLLLQSIADSLRDWSDKKPTEFHEYFNHSFLSEAEKHILRSQQNMVTILLKRSFYAEPGFNIQLSIECASSIADTPYRTGVIDTLLKFIGPENRKEIEAEKARQHEEEKEWVSVLEERSATALPQASDIFTLDKLRTVVEDLERFKQNYMVHHRRGGTLSTASDQGRALTTPIESSVGHFRLFDRPNAAAQPLSLFTELLTDMKGLLTLCERENADASAELTEKQVAFLRMFSRKYTQVKSQMPEPAQKIFDSILAKINKTPKFTVIEPGLAALRARGVQYAAEAETYCAKDADSAVVQRKLEELVNYLQAKRDWPRAPNGVNPRVDLCAIANTLKLLLKNGLGQNRFNELVADTRINGDAIYSPASAYGGDYLAFHFENYPQYGGTNRNPVADLKDFMDTQLGYARQLIQAIRFLDKPDRQEQFQELISRLGGAGFACLEARTGLSSRDGNSIFSYFQRVMTPELSYQSELPSKQMVVDKLMVDVTAWLAMTKPEASLADLGFDEFLLFARYSPEYVREYEDRTLRGGKGSLSVNSDVLRSTFDLHVSALRGGAAAPGH